jgi:hypothetical protein
MSSLCLALNAALMIKANLHMLGSLDDTVMLAFLSWC